MPGSASVCCVGNKHNSLIVQPQIRNSKFRVWGLNPSSGCKVQVKNVKLKAYKSEELKPMSPKPLKFEKT